MIALVALLASSYVPLRSGLHVASMQRLRGGAPALMSSPVAIVVDAEIEPGRVDEFLKVIEADVKGSREEEGCLRFDVVRASETRFFFYEAYVDADAVDVHKAQPHVYAPPCRDPGPCLLSHAA